MELARARQWNLSAKRQRLNQRSIYYDDIHNNLYANVYLFSLVFGLRSLDMYLLGAHVKESIYIRRLLLMGYNALLVLRNIHTVKYLDKCYIMHYDV
jgi:hypothetical protein